MISLNENGKYDPDVITVARMIATGGTITTRVITQDLISVHKTNMNLYDFLNNLNEALLNKDIDKFNEVMQQYDQIDKLEAPLTTFIIQAKSTLESQK